MTTLRIDQLREVLRGMRGLGLSRQKLPVLKMLRFEQGGGSLSVTGTNLDETLSYTTDAGEGEHLFLLSVKTLRDLCKGRRRGALVHISPMPENPVIRLEDEGILTETSFEWISPDEFPETPRTEEAMGPVLSQETMSALCRARHYTSKDPARFMLSTILVESGRVAATDGRQLYQSTTGGTGSGESLLVPAGAGRELLQADSARLFCDSPPVGDSRVRTYCLRQGPWSWTYRGVEGKYPSLDRVIPDRDKPGASVRLSESDVTLMETLMLMLPPEEKEPSAGISVDGDGALLLVGTGESRRVYRLTPDRVEADGCWKTQFNLRYLLRTVRDGFRTLRISEQENPLVLRNGGELALFMPQRYALSPEDWRSQMVETSTDTGPAEKVEAEVAVPGAEEVRVVTDAPPEEREEDGMAALVRDAGLLRDRWREGVAELGGLLKRAREAERRQRGLAREHRALKRTLRSLQALGG